MTSPAPRTFVTDPAGHRLPVIAGEVVRCGLCPMTADGGLTSQPVGGRPAPQRPPSAAPRSRPADPPSLRPSTVPADVVHVGNGARPRAAAALPVDRGGRRA